MSKFINLIIGGALGTIARYLASGCVYSICGSNFPYGTLIVNLIGCLFIGFLAAISEDKFALASNMRIFLMIGFCGAFTTFSTFMLETSNLMKDGEMLRAFFNVSLSILLGFIALRVGVFLGDII